MAINSKLDGLDVKFEKVGSYLYATVIHTNSGKTVVACTNQPLKVGKKEFCLQLDRLLMHIDWTAREDVLLSHADKLLSTISKIKAL